jgi:type I restriction enzyme R subunit
MKLPSQLQINEKLNVEEPFLRQLKRLGWTILRADEPGKYDPAITFRESFGEVIIEKQLREALLKINPWLEENQLPDIIRELTVPSKNSLLEANKEILEKLLENTSAENRHTGNRSDTVRFIDFKNPDNNLFLAVSQFKVNIPGTEKHIIPDIVLFINGLPVGVVECKSASVSDPMGEAMEQLLRYQCRRGESKEGNEKLFWYNQLLISTCRQTAKYSSITGEFEHFIEWKDSYPKKLSDIETEGGESVNSQQVLVEGMLARKNLLEIIQSFVLFQESDKGKLIKVVPRYQQYRTVCKIVERLKTGNTPLEKGGIVWHTQGSGKSLTMMMVVRKMNREEELTGYKIVFITDRKDLQKQLGDTARTIGYKINIANKITKAKEYLNNNTPDIVMVMIHKFQDDEASAFDPAYFSFSNPSEKILVMIDEGHRTQYSLLGANLAQSLPNATKVAFTGTPIKRTEQTFGNYIDKYTIRQAVADGVTVEIIYEGRTHSAGVSDQDAMNARFEEVFSVVDEETRRDILGRYTWRAYLEAEETIREKAKDMLKHYLTHIFPNGFKAQVVAVSRVAAVRYKKAFDELLSNEALLIDWSKELQAQYEIKKGIDLEQLKKLRAEIIISGGQNDKPELKEYTDDSKHENIISSFKMPFGRTTEDGVTGDVGILIVQSMLLTGFDAPIDQVMYLDNIIREHNLLQAIARVNRVAHDKQCGFIVDYVGVAKHLREALSKFIDKEDVEDILSVVKDNSKDIDELKFTQSELANFFKKYDIADINDLDACVNVLADEESRNDYTVLWKNFNNAMDKVLPNPAALPYVKDLKRYGFISVAAKNRYRDERLNIKDASTKIRDIIDEFLVSKGIDSKIPPLPIFSEKFQMKVTEEKSDKAKAEELKNGISEYIEEHIEEDPELYERLSEKLEKLLREYNDNWELLAKELQALLEEIRHGREDEENYGFDRSKEMPFLALLKKEIFGIADLTEMDQEQRDLLIQTTKDILEKIKDEIQEVGFWQNIGSQKRLKTFIAFNLLTAFKGNEAIASKKSELSQKLMELAFHLYR